MGANVVQLPSEKNYACFFVVNRYEMIYDMAIRLSIALAIQLPDHCVGKIMK